MFDGRSKIHDPDVFLMHVEEISKAIILQLGEGTGR